MSALRARGWHICATEAERNTRAAITDPRPEPGYLATLDAACKASPRFALAAVITVGMMFLALVKGMLTC